VSSFDNSDPGGGLNVTQAGAQNFAQSREFADYTRPIRRRPDRTTRVLFVVSDVAGTGSVYGRPIVLSSGRLNRLRELI
jgi:hypothetical protein